MKIEELKGKAIQHVKRALGSPWTDDQATIQVDQITYVALCKPNVKVMLIFLFFFILDLSFLLHHK